MDHKLKELTMNKIYILVTLFLGAAWYSQAQVIVSEDFDYAAGANLGGSSGGVGWPGGWQLLDGNEQTIVDDTLQNYRTGKASGRNLSMALSTNTSASEQARYTRALPTEITDDGSEYWLGFTLQVNERLAGSIGLSNLLLVDNTDPQDDKFVFGLLNSGNIGFGAAGGTIRQTAVNPFQPNWLVYKISFSGNADGDTIRFFANPDPLAEPANEDALATFIGGKLNTGRINAISIRAEGDSVVNAVYDDIYLGRDYTDILPSTAVDIPKYRPVHEKFEYAAGTGIEGKGMAANGWGGPWELTKVPNQDILAEQIVNSNILKITNGNSLFMDATIGDTRLTRPLAATYEDNGLVYWLSFFADFTDADVDNGVMNVMLINNDTETMTGSGPNGQFVGIGKSNSPGSLGVMSYGPFDFESKVENAAVGGRWFVARIETNGTADVDTVRLFLDPDPSVEPSVGTEDLAFAAQELNGGWKAIGLKQDAGANKSRIDDIYLALDYEDVVPRDLVNVAIPAPAFEKFEYDIGSIEGQGSSENGWGGPWELVGGTAQNIASSSITNEEIFRQTTGNTLGIDASLGTTRLARPLAERYQDNGLTYWMSFFAEFNNTTDNGVTTVMLINNDLETMGPSGGAGQFAAIGKWTSPGTLAVGSFGPFEESVLPEAAEGTHWLVARIETNGTAARDTIRLFVDPDPTTEPAVGTEVLKFAALELNGGWDAIGIKNDGGVSNSLIDDIYLGTTFTDVVPTDLVDIEFLFTAGATYEPFDYPTDENLAGNGIRANGFGGPWVQTTGDPVTLAAGSIETEFAVFEGNKARVNATTGGISYDRPLSGRFEDDGRTVWMSFLIDFETVEQISSEGQVVLMNGDEEVVGFGRTDGFNRLGFTWNEESFSFISNATTDGEHWVVVRIDMSGDDEAENAYMWVDPIPELQPATGTAIPFTTRDSDVRLTINDGFHGIRIKTAKGLPFGMLVDEIRLGYAYSDVSKIEEEIPENLIAREQFRYPPGEILTGLGSAGDQWAGPWTVASGGGGQAIVEEGSVSANGLSTLDNKINFVNNGSSNTRYERRLSTAISDDGNGYWFSFIADEEIPGDGVAQGGFSNGSEALVLFGKKFGPTNISILDIAANPQITEDTEAQADPATWHVIYTKFSGDAEQDSVYLWLNPDPTTPPTLETADATLFTTTLNDGFDAIFFRTEGGDGGDYLVDEIHFGTTFESIVPAGEDSGPVTGLEELHNNAFKLHHYPNPFFHTTTISYHLQQSGKVRLSIFNLQGREVSVLYEGQQFKGAHKVTWDGSDNLGNKLSAGMYLYRLQSEGQAVTKRIVLVQE